MNPSNPGTFPDFTALKSREEVLLCAVQTTGCDAHKATASWQLQKPYEAVTASERFNQKAANFAYLYSNTF